MTPKSTSEINEARKKKNEEAGLVKIAPTYWVHKSRREDALSVIRKALSAAKWRKKKPDAGDGGQ